MSVEKNKALAHTLTEEVWNKGNLDIVDDLLSTDYVFHHPGGQDSHGPEEYKQMVNAVRSAFPDIHFSINDVIAEGDKVAYR
jgi:predicted ester cyclase